MVRKNKTIIRAILMLSYVFIISIILFLISTLFTYFNTGADRSKMLHLEVKKIAQYTPTITWASNGNEGREIDSQTLNSIENDYLDAWYVKHVSYKTNIRNGIDDYYTESARENIFKNIQHNKKHQISVESTTLKHNPDLLFFSEDGQLAVLEDKNVIEFKKVLKKDSIVLKTTENANYKVILLLEDGFWRIRHLVKEGFNAFDASTNPVPTDSLEIRGINYYPQATPWNMFGDDFNIDIIQKDFKILQDANLNTIRIFIQYEDFGKAAVKKEKLDKLKQVLDSAKDQHLKVIVTLFDFYGNYDVLDWTLNYKHAKTIVTAFKNHEAILAWDLKNEPNLDFASRGKENVISWLEHLIILIKSIDTNHAITIGWSNIKSAPILKDKLDFVSFHYYEDITNFEKEYTNLASKIPNKPIVLGEFGLSSYRGFWKPFGNSEKDQAAYHQKMQKVLSKKKIPFMSWTLYDFKNIPEQVIGKIPWHVKPQKAFGFIDAKGNKKAAFKYISK